MQIEEIRAYRFGPWRDVQFALPQPTPVAVVMGRNEAGKSTLARFIRWTLFGSEKEAGRGGERETPPRTTSQHSEERSAARPQTPGTADDGNADHVERAGIVRVRFGGNELAVWRIARDGTERWGVVPAPTSGEGGPALPGDEAIRDWTRSDEEITPRTHAPDVGGAESEGAGSDAAVSGSRVEQLPEGQPAGAQPEDGIKGAVAEQGGAQGPPERTGGDVTEACRSLRAALQRLAALGAADACCLDLFALCASGTRLPSVVERAIFGNELPLAARQVLAALDRARETLGRLHAADGGGTLSEAVRTYREAQQLEQSFKTEQAHRWQTVARARHRRQELQEAFRRREGLQHQLRGHRLLDRAWPLWNREREIRRMLEQMPALPANHEQAAERFREIEAALQDVENQWRATGEQLREARARFDSVRNVRRWMRARPSVERLIRQAERCERETGEVERLRQQAERLKTQLQGVLNGLGPQWTDERVAGLNVSWGMHVQLLQVARDYETELSRQHRLRRRVSRLDRLHRRAAARLQEACRARGAATLEHAAARLREQIAVAKQRRGLRLRLHDLEQSREQLIASEQRAQLAAEPPRWMYVVLAAFVAVGTFAVVAGLVTGLSSNWLAGLGYVFLGLTSTAMAWAWKRHLGHDVAERWQQLQQRVRDIDRAIMELRQRLQQDAAPLDEPAPSADAGQPADGATPPDGAPVPVGQPTVAGRGRGLEAEVDELARLTHALAELELLQQRQRRLAAMRRRLTALRQRLQVSRRKLTSARRRWFDELQRLGIGSGELLGGAAAEREALMTARHASETSGGSLEGARGRIRQSLPGISPRLKNAFAVLEHLGRATELQAALRRTQRELARRQRWIETFGERVAAVAARFDLAPADSEPWETVRQWSQRLLELEQHDASIDERRRSLIELRRRRAALRRARRRLRKRALRLWKRWQAGSKQEFWQNIEIARQRAALRDELQLVREELQQLAEQHADLAITEDDLRMLDPEENAEQMQTVEAELRDTEADIRATQAECEALEAQIADFAADLQGQRLRFERRAAERALRKALQDGIAARLAHAAVMVAKGAVERTSQPAVLRSASDFLRQMTEGRYATLWVPLGERTLRIDTAGGDTVECDELALSTRVLLHLALRLAIWRTLCSSEIPFPLVLDGVCVAFDESRLRAVAETLAIAAGTGVGGEPHASDPSTCAGAYVLTCHWGVAEAFSEFGADLAELPETFEASRSMRRAG